MYIQIHSSFSEIRVPDKASVYKKKNPHTHIHTHTNKTVNFLFFLKIQQIRYISSFVSPLPSHFLFISLPTNLTLYNARDSYFLPPTKLTLHNAREIPKTRSLHHPHINHNEILKVFSSITWKISKKEGPEMQVASRFNNKR